MSASITVGNKLLKKNSELKKIYIKSLYSKKKLLMPLPLSLKMGRREMK